MNRFVKLLILQEDLEKLETEPAKPKRQVSKEILIKTTAMAEDAFKLERDKANHLEDVRTGSYVRCFVYSTFYSFL